MSPAMGAAEVICISSDDEPERNPGYLSDDSDVVLVDTPVRIRQRQRGKRPRATANQPAAAEDPYEEVVVLPVDEVAEARRIAKAKWPAFRPQEEVKPPPNQVDDAALAAVLAGAASSSRTAILAAERRHILERQQQQLLQQQQQQGPHSHASQGSSGPPTHALEPLHAQVDQHSAPEEGPDELLVEHPPLLAGLVGAQRGHQQPGPGQPTSLKQAAKRKRAVEQDPQPLPPTPPQERLPQRQRRQRCGTREGNQLGPLSAPAGAAAVDGAQSAQEGRGGAEGRQYEGVRGRALLRGTMAALHEDVMARREVLADPATAALAAHLARAAELAAHVTRPAEGALHAGLMASLAECAVDMARGVQQRVSQRGPGDLVRCLLACHGGAGGYASQSQGGAPGRIDWRGLGAGVATAFRPAPGLSSMLGALAAAPKTRKAAQRHARPVAAEVVRPEEVEVGAQAPQTAETNALVEVVLRVLQAAGQAPFLELVLDHSSFAHTAENMFALSFLVRDGFARLEADEALGLMVAYNSERRPAPGKSGPESQGEQFAMEFDMEEWGFMKSLVQPGSTLMPPRSTGREGQPWAGQPQPPLQPRGGN